MTDSTVLAFPFDAGWTGRWTARESRWMMATGTRKSVLASADDRLERSDFANDLDRLSVLASRPESTCIPTAICSCCKTYPQRHLVTLVFWPKSHRHVIASRARANRCPSASPRISISTRVIHPDMYERAGRSRPSGPPLTLFYSWPGQIDTGCYSSTFCPYHYNNNNINTRLFH